ncbi:MAG: ATP phosphoribosyltransferase regulatory subunit [Clostridium baratii]|uniref:ATP phosphoribosyltransferase regulatory subunit n=1 Tax=Clostridium baratii str. Sullivan TaxID=1415775 RepID=A0A0A7FY13_9CLOT|nr:ATP phosphoribosyltransferase regulatory subunit [Clostridium baratii]AIY84507.1 ATP phosphoribosyltransferase, regulatory subunit [Clostridium baratii str. Sullivan]MBS6005606.1 ATP phosphoribosyltransferase regulatory subunit [Clostridium baratii]MDU4910168.1 ATP phosphoribosyltransferase regulatory subunit [Clostridium baratii]
MRNKNIIPEGSRDLIFNECRKKKIIINGLEKTFETFGYDEVITPTVEYYKTFSIDDKCMDEEKIYKFFESSGRILALRPDMTLPIARVVSTKMKEVKTPIRLRYTSNIFRVNRKFDGKKNEYTDLGVELIGVPELDGDIEVLTMALEGFKKLNISNFKLEIGNIKFFNEIFDKSKIREDEKEKLAELIEEKSLIELEKFLNSLEIEESKRNFFKRLPWLFGDEDILNNNIEFKEDKDVMSAILYLKKINKILKELGYEDNITFDLGMVPGVNYYTGIIFKGYIEGARAPVLSGGRYDNLIKSFGRDLPAVGFSIDVDLILENINFNNEEKIKEYIIYYGKNKLVQAIKESRAIRDKGIRVKLLACDEENLFNIYKGE